MRRKVSLYIGDRLADLSDESFILFNYAKEDLTNPTVVRNSWSQQVTLPGTAANGAIFGHIYRSDRQTLYGTSATGIHFDASVRTPFRLISDTGELLESGYLKLDNIIRRGNRVQYKVSLYGNLGAFFYGLMYDEQGNKRSLADLRYTGETATADELTFTITAAAVRNAWDRIANGGSGSSIWDVLNFAVCYDGLPDGMFGADKAVCRPSKVGLNIPSGYSAVDGWSLVSLPDKHTGLEVRDLRSYLQRPVIKMRKIIEAICQPWNNGGYTVELDTDFFNDGNSYWDKTWMTLPLLNKLAIDIDEHTEEINVAVATPPFNTQTLQLGGVATAQYLVNVQITPAVYGSGLAASTSWLLHGIDDGNVEFQTWLAYTVQLLNGDTIIDTKSVVVSTSPALNRDVPVIDVVGEFRPVDDTIAHFTASANVVLQGTGATAVRVRCWVNSAVWGGPPAHLYDSTVFSRGTFANVLHRWAENITDRRTRSAVVRSGHTITKADLLSGSQTPADYLLSFCKMFGLVFVYDKVAKKVTIKTRSSFYDIQTPHDIGSRVDVGKDITVRPFAFDARWYEFGPEVLDSEFAGYYAKIYGQRYGMQRVNTGYAFDASSKDLLEGNALKVAPEVQEVSKYYVTFRKEQSGTSFIYPSVFQDGGKYQLVDGSGNPQEFDITGIPANAAAVYWNSQRPLYDFDGRLQLHGSDNSPLDGQDVLLFYDGSYNPQPSVEGLAVSDDLDVMTTMNGNTPCWILGWGEFLPSTKVTSLPRFHRYLRGSGSEVTRSLDFGTPLEVGIGGITFNASSSIYEAFWQTYIADRYDDDSKVMDCTVDLSGIQVGPDLLSKFYWFEGAWWSLNKVSNYSVTTFDDVECQFVKVQDRANYTSRRAYYLTVSPSNIQVGLQAAGLPVSVFSNVAWYATSNEAWITVTPASGSGDGNIVLNIARYTGTSQRTGVVTFHCTDQQGVPDVSIVVLQTAEQTYYLQVSAALVEFTADTGTYSLQVYSNTSWTIVPSIGSWCSLDQYSGSGNETVVISAAANPGGMRQGTLIFSSSTAGVPSVSVTVQQQATGAGDYLSAVPAGLQFDASPAGPQTVRVSANVRWTAIGYDWVTVSPASGTGDGNLVITVAANQSTSARQSIVMLHNPDGLVPDFPINVYQRAATSPYYLSCSPQSVSAGNAGGTEQLLVSANVAWQATSNVAWVTVSPSTGSGAGTITLTIANNASTSQRTGVVTLHCTNQAGVADVTIGITQAPAGQYFLYTDVSSLSFDAAASGSYLVDVFANCGWAVMTAASWLNISPASGTFDGTISVSAAPNTGASRTASIVLYCTDQQGVDSVTINVTQAGSSPTPTGSVYMRDPDKAGIVDYMTIGYNWGGANIVVHSSGNYHIVSDVPWLHQYGSSSQVWSGPAVQALNLWVSADNNTTGTSRVGVLTITLDDDPSVQATFTVTQQG